MFFISAVAGAKPTIEFNHAVAYVAKIKHRFRDHPAIYAEFLDILHDYQAKRTIDEVYSRVQRLFHGEQDLLDEFKYFLPDTQGGQAPSTNSMSQQSSSNYQSKSMSSTQSSRPGTTTVKTSGKAGSIKQKSKEQEQANRKLQQQQSYSQSQTNKRRTGKEKETIPIQQGGKKSISGIQAGGLMKAPKPQKSKLIDTVD